MMTLLTLMNCLRLADRPISRPIAQYIELGANRTAGAHFKACRPIIPLSIPSLRKSPAGAATSATQIRDAVTKGNLPLPGKMALVEN